MRHFALSLVVASNVFAQTPRTSVLVARVVDALTGEPVRNAALSLTDLRRDVRTNDSGVVRIADIRSTKCSCVSSATLRSTTGWNSTPTPSSEYFVCTPRRRFSTHSRSRKRTSLCRFETSRYVGPSASVISWMTTISFAKEHETLRSPRRRGSPAFARLHPVRDVIGSRACAGTAVQAAGLAKRIVRESSAAVYRRAVRRRALRASRA